uniref:Ion transport domain-containing protein n=1 Tax=Biomphalaria glabrata TaxID=6526 RepID=A0A2C9K8A9_BIOGL
MSEREKEWGGLVAGDTGPAMLSISAGKSRSQPPDKGTAGSRAAAAESHGGNHAVGIPEKQQQTFSPLGCSAPEAVLPSRGKKALCSRHSEPEPLQDHHDRTCVGAGELSSRSQSPKHLLEPRRHSSGKEALRNAHVQREHLTSDPAVTYIQDGGTKTDTWKTSGNSNETDILLGCLIDPSEGQNKNFRKDYAALDNSESTFTSPPRLFRCRRQNRVQSPDDPETNRTLPKPVHSLSDSNFPAHLESCCKFYVDGRSLDISSDKLSVETDDPSSVFISSPTRNDEILQKLSSDRKRSSADRESVISVTTSDDRHSGSFELGGKKKKKTKNRFSNASEQDRSSLSLSVPASRGNSDTGAADDDTNRPPSSSSSTKGSHRRFAKRGLSGVFPSSNWRRLRNTLKAANEMQSNKKTKHALNREDSFLRKFSTRNHQNLQNSSLSADEDVQRYQNASKRFESRFVIQHDGNFMFYWLGVVTLSVLYNIWTPIAREAFKEIQEGCHVCWFFFDALFDLIYILDIVVQFRTGYLDQGLMVYDSKKLRDRYSKSKVIYIDFISLLPLDLVQIAIGIHPMMRFPRFLKVYRTFRFLHMMESRTAYPNLIRVANLTHILFLGAHWFAAFYYMISEAEDFKGDWAYPKPVGPFADVNRKYLRSLFWSTLTLTTIGDLPPPDNNNDLRMSNAAYVFVIVSYLIGVFVFATIVGQVGNVINNRNASRQEFERLLDGAKIYMQTHNVPHNLQKRVQRWYDYVWSRGRLNGCDINSLGLLPDKLKTELAIHVNLETLKK